MTTMTELETFHFNEQPFAAFLLDGVPCFMAADTCAALSITNVGNAIAALDDDEKGSIRITDGTPGTPNRAYITEAGLYSLVLRSRKPEAKAFKRWITHDVLPAIRRTGGYLAPAHHELTGPELLARAVLEAAETIKAQQVELETARPKAEAFDSFLSATGDLSVRDAAHAVSRKTASIVGERRLRALLEQWRWIYRDSRGKPRAYQAQIDLGRLAEKSQFHFHPETGERVVDTPQVRVTAKGLDAIRSRIAEEQSA
ncbi:phage antirepressor KilAC domain-containing protein [Kocuria rosea]|uniref:phage antirepressor KilAC domain-containing protein n=1 Tax=Kocuria rosea TaxID=1275 RepID=UPI003D3378B8